MIRLAIAHLCRLRTILCFFAMIGVLWIPAESLFSQQAGRSTTSLPTGQQVAPPKEKTPGEKALEGAFSPEYSTFQRPSLLSQAVIISLLALLPFIVMILTPFLKIVIVLSLLRNALGVQQSPPNQILNGVAFMLSIFIIYPTGLKMWDAASQRIAELHTPESIVSPESSAYAIQVAAAMKEPAREYLQRNSTERHQALFYRMSYKALSEENRALLQPTDFMILVPSYITSQLKDAFEIGVLIYIPFFVIDIVTSNILLAMGMMMLSPVTISMPLKLFLLVMLDGWTLLIEGLVNTFH